MTLLTKIDNNIENNISGYSKYYIYIIVFTYVLYISVFIGVVSLNYKYLRYFSNFVQFIIAVFLIIRFHPFKKNLTLKEGDSRVIYSSGLFLLINLGATEFVIWFYNDILQKLKIIN